jgi:hypothetical protein
MLSCELRQTVALPRRNQAALQLEGSDLRRTHGQVQNQAALQLEGSDLRRTHGQVQNLPVFPRAIRYKALVSPRNFWKLSELLRCKELKHEASLEGETRECLLCSAMTVALAAVQL